MSAEQKKILAVAKVLAGFNGDGWVFEPPIMDGMTRSGTDSSVYLRQAREVLAAANAVQPTEARP